MCIALQTLWLMCLVPLPKKDVFNTNTGFILYKIENCKSNRAENHLKNNNQKKNHLGNKVIAMCRVLSRVL